MKDDSLTNRTLFDLDRVQLFTGQNDSNHEESTQRSQRDISSNPDVKDTEERSQPLTPFESGLTNQIGVIRALFYCQELFTDWVREFSIRPTGVSTILSITIYCVAVASTIKKREGDRWLRSTLQAKLPGYSTLYQQSSWESLRNCVFEKQINPYSGCTDNLKSFENNPESCHTRLTQPFPHRSTHRSDILEFVDLHKDKAFVYVRSPWAKKIRKDFVGVFPDREFVERSGCLPSDALVHKNHILLPWYRIEALHKPSQTVLSRSEKRSTGESFNQNGLRGRRERSLLYLRENRTPITSTSPKSTVSTKIQETRSALALNSIRDKIVGLEYLSPFGESRGRVYAENDMIPLKLESPYGVHSLRGWCREGREPRSTHSAQTDSGGAKSARSVQDLSTPSQLTLNSTLSPFTDRPVCANELLTQSDKALWVQRLNSFQHRLRELFYLYGFSPPNSLTALADKRWSRPELKEHSLDAEQNAQKDQGEADLHTLEESFDLDKSRRFKRDRREEISQNPQREDQLAHNNLGAVDSELIKDQSLERSPLSLRSDLGDARGLAREKLFYSHSPAQPGMRALGVRALGVRALDNSELVDAITPLGVSHKIPDLVDLESVGRKEDELSNQLESEMQSNRLRLRSAPTAESKGASFSFTNWPLLANASSFAPEIGPPLNNFERNNLISPRLMSGYRLPDYTQKETSCFFKDWVLRHLFISCSVRFSHSYLIDQLLLCPLYLQLPPAVPFSFFQNLALSLSQLSPSSISRPFSERADWITPNCSRDVQPDNVQVSASSVPERVTPIGQRRIQAVNPPYTTPTFTDQPKYSDITLEYKLASLQESKQIEDAFAKIGKDLKVYSSLPKDSPLAIEMAPSLEDDKILESEDRNREKREDEPDTPWEILQKLREQEKRFEDGKEFRPFAYQDRLAYQHGDPVATPSFENKLSEENSLSDLSTLPSDQAEQENAWIRFRLGSQNMCSDRKYSFFGRKQLLTKRLVAQEEKEIDEQLLKSSYCTPDRRRESQPKEADPKQESSSHEIPLHGKRTAVRSREEAQLPELDSIPVKREAGLSAKAFSLNERSEISDQLNQEEISRCTSLQKLHRKAHKRLIKLLGSPRVAARDAVGARNRTRRAHRLVRGRVIETPFERLRWQKKRFRSRLLTAPSRRHLVLPQISSSDWGKMLEWQLKNYFFLEERRIEKLREQDPYENFKHKRVQIYLPWVTVRTPSNKPFQWPLTRLDYTDQTAFAQIRESFCTLPTYKGVEYWDAGKSLSLSLPLSEIPYRDFQSDGSRAYKESEPFLFEPLHDHSWMLVYRLFLAFALQNLFKYIYRVGVKRFIVQIMNSDLGLMTTSPQFREWIEYGAAKPFYTPDKRLRDVAAVQDNIPTLSEIVWYLRNYGRGRAKCRGLLLVGPSGAEKTSVVQALAGECRRPVIVQSMNALLLTSDDPYEQLEKMFALARKKAPCILFLDDLDVIGQSRGNVIRSDVGAEDLLFSLDGHTAEGRLSFANCSHSLHTTLLPPPGESTVTPISNWELNPLASNCVYQPDVESTDQEEGERKAVQRRGSQALAAHQDNEEFQRRRLNLMLRLLTEMDGGMTFNGVVVVATSQRPALLDPALLRAGRFDRRVHLSLPSKERRIQLFQRETQKIGSMQSIPWDYLGTRTTDMSVADISSAINHSAIRAILDNTVHTVETLEHGLNCVAGLPNKPFSISDVQQNDPFHFSRLAFYQAGRAVVHNLLLDHPDSGFCSLTDRTANHSGGSTPSELARESLQVRTPDQISSTSHPRRLRLRFERAGSKMSEFASGNEEERERYGNSGDTAKRGGLSSQKEDNSPQSQLNPGSQARGQGLRAGIDATFSARTRAHFEVRLVGLYAGKAAELLHLSCSERSGLREMRRSGEFNSLRLHGFDSLAAEAVSQARKVNRVNWEGKTSRSSGWLWQSNLGFSELLRASSLIHLMVDRWYLYSDKLFTYKVNRVVPSLNHEQMRDETLFPLGRRLSQQLEFDTIKPPFWGITSYTNPKGFAIESGKQDGKREEQDLNPQIHQERVRAHWWQAKICQALERTDRPYGKWYRIYLPKANEDKWNEEWVPPDSIFHQSLTLPNLASKERVRDQKEASTRDVFGECSREAEAQGNNLSQKHGKGLRRLQLLRIDMKDTSSTVQRVPPLKTLNDLYLFERDRAYHSAVMNSFYTAFDLLNDNRELLDLFADHLIRYQIVRSHEIRKICSLFSPSDR